MDKVHLYGTVGAPFWGEDSFTPKEVREQLSSIRGPVEVHLNSGGGAATDGQAIYAILKAHPHRVTVIVEGCAASAASLIAMAGAEIVLTDGAWLLLHDPATPWTDGRGTPDDHAKTAQLLDQIAVAYAEIYARRSGNSVDDVRALMRAETLLVGDAAVQMGFADRVDREAETKAVGDRDVKALTRADVIAAQKANAHRTRFANYVVQIFVVLCEHAIDLGWIDRNPAKGARALKTPEARQQSHVPWPDRAVERFRAEAGHLPRLIFEIGVGTVQRPGDWTSFTWGDYDPAGDGTLRLRQSKTGQPLVLPCTERLKAALEAEKARLGFVPIASRPILCSATGGRMSYRYLADIMLKERRRLGLDAFDLHALRYRGVMELAWEGCSDDEIASYSGHKTTEMIAKYAGEARQVMHARKARLKRQ